MKLELPVRSSRTLANATDEEQEEVLDKTTFSDMLSWDADFEEWAHKAQLPPKQEGWRTWLMLAGRGFGKTRAGAEWIEKIALSRPGVRIALVGATIDEARRVMVEGVSGVLSVARRRRHKVKWEPSLGRLTWPNGSQAQIFSGDNPDGLRGPEHDFAWGAPAARLPGRGRNRGAGPQRSSRRACTRSGPSRRIIAHQ
ncbi:MAG: terminase large subunit domain-containing protein [Sphingomicrobium sp.]